MKINYKRSLILGGALLLTVLAHFSFDFTSFFPKNSSVKNSNVEENATNNRFYRQYPAPKPLPEETLIFPQSMEETTKLYEGIKMSEVPHIFVEALPPDWQIRSTEDKTLFMKIMTAQILRTNERILAEKQQLSFLEEKFLNKQPWTKEDEAFFQHLLEKYDIHLAKKREGQLHELLEKVDIIPPSMAVAQATLITDWGLQNMQSPYGEYGWVDNAYVPLKFKTLSEATDSFARQINSRMQLFEFHFARKHFIPYQNDRYISSHILHTIAEYMDWDKDYIKKLEKTYRSGYFLQLDQASFKQPDEKEATN